MNEEGYEPGNGTLHCYDKEGPASAQFTSDGGYCCHARRIEQTEHHDANGGCCGEDCCDGVVCKKRAEGAYHHFLGKESAGQCGDNAPVV